MSDNETIDLLRDILKELKEIKERQPPVYIPQFPSPISPPYFPPPESKYQCPRCGLTISTVMGYVCPQLGCPVGLGNLQYSYAEGNNTVND